MPLKIIAFYALLLITWFSYQNGLDGDFLFDDRINLEALGNFGPIDDWAVFWRYITSGSADITGRPVAMLSFLIDANNWPAHPYAFKRTSILLHLLNGVLLFWLIFKLNNLLKIKPNSSYWIALSATAFWLLHPFLVSTVLYIIQRQAMLVATFSLIAFLFYIHGRKLYIQQPKKALIYLSLSIGVSILMATLSKANGALLPLWLLLLEWLILNPVQPIQSRAWQIWKMIFLILPSFALLAYLGHYIPDDIFKATSREFSWYERIITQPRILWDYIQHLFLPSAYTSGLFNDDFQFSTGLKQPPSTLWAIIALLSVLSFAFFIRRRSPILAFSILFFFAAHIMESSVIMLELYFEHRNYVPALFLFWFPSYALIQSRLSITLKALILIAVLGLWFALSFMRADLWGNAKDQALFWARLNPDSARAQAQAAIHEVKQGRYAAALQRLQKAAAIHPNSAQIIFSLAAVHCYLYQRLPNAVAEQVATVLVQNKESKRIAFQWLQDMILMHGNGQSCLGFNRPFFYRLIEQAEQSDLFQEPRQKQSLANLKAMLALQEKQPAKAKQYLLDGIRQEAKPDVILVFVALLGQNGYPQYGLELLQEAIPLWQEWKQQYNHPSSGMGYIHQKVLEYQGYWQSEFNHIRQLLLEDIASQQASSSVSH